MGYIYILTNPSFPEYVKIGYAKDVKNRLSQLNHAETVPFAFRVYATYEVKDALTDKEVHKLIDKLNPELRSIEEFIKLSDMLNNWKAEIVNSFAKINGTRVSNGPVEGRNSLIKKILKIANSYTNFKRFRNRVIYCLNTLAKHNFKSQ